LKAPLLLDPICEETAKKNPAQVGWGRSGTISSYGQAAPGQTANQGVCSPSQSSRLNHTPMRRVKS